MKTVLVSRGKQQLALLWLTGIALPGCLLFVQSVQGFYGDDAQEVARWFIGAVSPTGGLIVAALVADAGVSRAKDLRVSGLIYRIALGVSVLYLLALWTLILYARAADGGLPQLAKDLGGWLNGLQGVVTLVLGVFFVRKSEPAASKNQQGA